MYKRIVVLESYKCHDSFEQIRKAFFNMADLVFEYQCQCVCLFVGLFPLPGAGKDNFFNIRPVLYIFFCRS